MKTSLVICFFTLSALFFTACNSNETAQQQEKNQTQNNQPANTANSSNNSQNQQQSTNNGSTETDEQPKHRVIGGISGQLPPALFQQQVNEMKEKTLIDLRTPQEIAETGKIKGAINIDFYADNVETQFKNLKKSEPVLVYCAKGGRSHDAYNMLRKMGFTRVIELKGGMDAWLDAGLEVDKTK